MNYYIPNISVVIPVYNVEKYIQRCLNSFLSQTYSEYELILVDDGSQDGSANICQAYINRFRQKGVLCTIIHQNNGGLSSARNTGIEWALQNSSSKWLTFVDSDDWVHPGYLSYLISGAERLSADVIIGRYERVSDKGDENEDNLDDTYVAKMVDIGDYWINHRTNATVAWGKLYLKSLFSSFRYPVGKYHEDEFVTYRILFNGVNVGYIDKPVYYYFQNNSGIMKKNYMQRLPDLLEVFRQHISFFKKTQWHKVYRLEVEKYAEALSEGIWFLSRNQQNDRHDKDAVKSLRIRLKKFLKKHKKEISFAERRDIYIAAYPSQVFFIRLFGWIVFKVRSFLI